MSVAIRNTTPNIGKFNAARAALRPMHVSKEIIEQPARTVQLEGGIPLELPALKMLGPGVTYNVGRNKQKRVQRSIFGRRLVS